MSKQKSPCPSPLANTKQAEEGDSVFFRQQLLAARNEINNLRHQIRALASSHQQEVERIHNALSGYQEKGCTCSCKLPAPASSASKPNDDNIVLPVIGVVNTWFPEKKGTPRQPGICIGSQGKVTLYNTVFTNPEHSLEGLGGYSHMWILFHFHKNGSTHIRAKVSPPRLNGVRTGVFATRSPHRPSPIGLSLVSIDRVEGTCVYFSGADMVDGTPVLDIKPYIPQYDNPINCMSPDGDLWATMSNLRILDGGEEESDVPTASSSGDHRGNPIPVSPSRPLGNIGEREAPDGEEGARSLLAAAGAGVPAPTPSPVSSSPQVRVPTWIDQPPVSKFTVLFSERSASQLEELDSSSTSASNLRTAISSVLREDPRSVYLREKWGNQTFTFLMHGVHVSCKFDDEARKATVFQITSAGKTCECGQPEWQCTIHGDNN